ncbi:hypothetical protein KB206_03745 [Microvirga sp. STS02]|uniref:hypothetical protein n=1 Tax=Hymenobacter negativus TaxID=2795026 RepID=UPI0018DE7429|nr:MULTISPECIES: hypothetical protein [Bacteria]MBH8567980.1 hypothetical protein [Hymenobacter negativus]MBR7207716.1 hypothetical protein [Microvirga sp. STS02]
MQTTLTPSALAWPWWRKWLFCFSCLYLLLFMSPWTWLSSVPGFATLAGLYGDAESWLVNQGNAHLFHVKDVLVPLNGSGDTSYGYAQLCFYALAAMVGATLWVLLDRRRRNYALAYYWLLVLVRYFVALSALSYGILKLFALQMIFPPLSALATPLGDLLPMRFSWYFIGYSQPYQVFSGAAEVLAGALLLWRRTSTLGAVVAASVFLNVMMMNLCYDIPVKLFSMHLFALSLFLLVGDAERLLNFFVFNRPTQPAWTPPPLPRRWRVAQLTLKTIFIVLFALLPFYQFYQQQATMASGPPKGRLTTGVFEVEKFDAPLPDSLRWKDVIFETSPTGSILTTDTLLRQRYRRGYFAYTLDSAQHTIDFKKMASDSLPAFTLRYAQPDTNHVVLRGKIRNDSVFVALRRQKRHFQLAERQFHWLSEANR